jgi:hypothetical protein
MSNAQAIPPCPKCSGPRELLGYDVHEPDALACPTCQPFRYRAWKSSGMAQTKFNRDCIALCKAFRTALRKLRNLVAAHDDDCACDACTGWPESIGTVLYDLQGVEWALTVGESLLASNTIEPLDSRVDERAEEGADEPALVG